MKILSHFLHGSLIFILIFLCGCKSLKQAHHPTLNEKMLEAITAQKQQDHFLQVQEESLSNSDLLQTSLWARSRTKPTLIRNLKAQKVGDLLTIVIDEQAQASTSAQTDAKRDNKIDMSGALKLGTSTTAQKAGMSTQVGNKNEFKGEGKTDRSGRFQTIVQSVVENLMPNGTLFVRGHKMIVINHEEQEVEISGFVRPDDIRINNTVLSSLMADAQIKYVGRGVVSDKQHTGWGTRLLDAIWPF